MTPAELQTIIQHAASELSDQIDAINANMLERLRRCTTMPTGSCAGEQRKECDFCKINDIIAAIRENREVVQLPPVEMLAVIQRDNYERSWRRNHAATTAAMQNNLTTRRKPNNSKGHMRRLPPRRLLCRRCWRRSMHLCRHM